MPRPPRLAWKAVCFLGLMLLCAIGISWLIRHGRNLRASEHPPANPAPAPAALASDSPNTLLLLPETVRSMRLSVQPAEAAVEPIFLRLTGQLMLDTNRLVHVHTRFSGEVVLLGHMQDQTPAGVISRPVRVGDHVATGQLLAVIWSKEVGEKKSDLVDALSQLALHESLYKNLKTLQSSGAVPQRSIDEMQREYESDLIEVERLRRTLRSWRIDEQELAECEAEARRIHAHASQPPGAASAMPAADPRLEARWAEIEVRAPFDGVILEKNFTVGDIVGAEQDLYKVADLSRLRVMANIYEEHLPILTKIPREERRWQITLPSEPDASPVGGQIETIGSVIDRNQHTAAVWGWIDNPLGQLRVGQFIEADVPVPTPEAWVEIPAAAIIDAGERKYVFVPLDETLTKVQRREVRIERRTARKVYLPRDRTHGILPGEPVLTRGVMELSSVLDDLKPPQAE